MKTTQEVVISLGAPESLLHLLGDFSVMTEKSDQIVPLDELEHTQPVMTTILTFSKNIVSVLVLCLLTSVIPWSFPINLGFFCKGVMTGELVIVVSSQKPSVLKIINLCFKEIIMIQRFGRV